LNTLLLVSIFISGIILIIQDWKSKSIGAWLLLLFSVSVISYSFFNVALRQFCIVFIYNIGYLLLLFILLTIYFSFKNRKLENILDRYLGWGDVLVLIALCSAYIPIRFVLFVTLCSLFAAIMSFFLVRKEELKKYSIPFVSYIVFFYLCLWTFELLGKNTKFLIVNY
jgi:hypothetical protein